MWAMAELTAQTDSHLGSGVRKKNEQTKGRGSWVKTEFGQDAAICLGEEAIFLTTLKCPYHMTFDLYLNWPWAHSGCRLIWGPLFASLVAFQPFAWEKKRIFVKSQKCPYHVTFDLDLDLEHILDAGRASNHRVQVWWWSSNLPARLREEAIFVKSQVSVSRELWPRPWPWAHLECRPVWDHGVQVCSRSSHLSGRRSDLRKI